MSHRRVRSTAIARRRSAMGEYLPAAGERPLSSYALPTPSAFDYHPSTKTLPSSPCYSLRSRPRPLKYFPFPSPQEYTVKGSIEKKNKSTLTRKGKTWPYNPREDSHLTCSPGAGHYKLTHGDTGSSYKRTLSAYHREGLHPGHPNLLVQPVDTLGFKTPGPGLWRDSVRGTEKTFGMALNQATQETNGPGPAEYTLPTRPPPAPVIGQLLHVDTGQHFPSPNEYTINGSVGNGQNKSFGIKCNTTHESAYPAPNTYNLRHSQSGGESHAFCYRPFPIPAEPRPGPAEYRVGEPDLCSPPKYSCRQQCKPVFPDVLLYQEHSTLDVPAPGNYESGHNFANNSSAKPSIGLPLPKRPNTNPGPNQYAVKQHSLSTAHTPPSFSIAKLLPPSVTQHRSPGPADYSPRPASATAAVSMSPRREKVKGCVNPAANSYHVEEGQTRRGHFRGLSASFKGRPSTACYPGFSTCHLARLSSLAM